MVCDYTAVWARGQCYQALPLNSSLFPGMCLQLGIFLYSCGMHSFVIGFGVIYPSGSHDKRKGRFCCYLGYSWYKNVHDQLLAFRNVNSPNCYGSVQIMYADAPFSMSCSKQKAGWNKATKMASSLDGSFSYIGDYLAHSPMPSNTVGSKAL